jgi:thioredoxin 1
MHAIWDEIRLLLSLAERPNFSRHRQDVMKINELEAKIKSAKKPLLVEFWAPWCGPCKIMAPRLTQAASQFTDQVELVRVNADQSPDVVRKLNVMGIPTMVAFAGGDEIFRRVGLQNEQALEEVFRAAAQARKPEFKLRALDRVMRSVLGLVVAAVGAASGPNYLVLGIGGILLFSAVYDRCPIYRAITSKLGEIFGPKKAHQA